MSSAEEAIKALIRKQSKRDKQEQIGPSELGNPCDRCLGLRMAHRVPDGPRPRSIDESGLKAWIGTAVHSYLKELGDQTKKFRKSTMREFDVPVCTIEGYGDIVGHCDLVYDDGWLSTVVDYKTTDLVRIKKYKSHGVPEQYRRQAHLYAYGVSNMQYHGNLVTKVGLFFVPRDSNNFNEIWYWEEPYDEQVALAAIKHATKIFKRMCKGELELLTSHPECYDCNGMVRDITFVDE